MCFSHKSSISCLWENPTSFYDSSQGYNTSLLSRSHNKQLCFDQADVRSTVINSFCWWEAQQELLKSTDCQSSVKFSMKVYWRGAIKKLVLRPGCILRFGSVISLFGLELCFNDAVWCWCLMMSINVVVKCFRPVLWLNPALWCCNIMMSLSVLV